MKKTSLIAAIATLALAACAAPPPPDYAAQYQPMVDGYVAGWNEGKYDDFGNILTADFKRRAPGMDADGIDGIAQVMTNIRAGYPDGHVTLDESHYMKDMSIHLWTFTGTNTGSGDTPPTGKAVENHGMALIHYRDGKMAEEIVQFDRLGWMQQLGYTLTPPAAEPAPAGK